MTNRSNRRHRHDKSKPASKSAQRNQTPKTEPPTTPEPMPENKKGIYTEYLDRQMDGAALQKERQKQLRRISDLREGRAIIAYTAGIKPPPTPIGIDYADLTAINDQLSVLEGERLDLILETPGGSGEAAEDIVKLIRNRFSEFNIIVPGMAKSAGTIIAMAGDEILMEPVSSLGPIDAQLTKQGKQLSADDLIQALDDIKAEVNATGKLNQALIPMLQSISPGELKHAQNAMDFAHDLVAEWLVKYKFKNWNKRRRDGSSVTHEDKVARAKQIAKGLQNRNKWRTHGRSIKIEDLRELELDITDYSLNPDLADAIRRYHILAEMTLNHPALYKLFETPTTMIAKTTAAVPIPAGGVQIPVQGANAAGFELAATCNNCGTRTMLEGGIGKPVVKRKPGNIAFPPNNIVTCPGCNSSINVAQVRAELEAKLGKKVY